MCRSPTPGGRWLDWSPTASSAASACPTTSARTSADVTSNTLSTPSKPGLSLIDYLDDRDLIAWCGEQKIAVTIYEPLGSGILTDRPYDDVVRSWVGTPWEESEFFERLLSPEFADRSQRVVHGLRTVGQEIGASVSQVAIAWVLRQPGVTSAIAGSGNADRFRENAGAAEVELSSAATRTLDDLIPLGPAFA